MDISVVIPAYNEIQRLPGTLRRIHEYLTAKGWTFEILVVDDGSMDGTGQTAIALGLSGLRVIRQEPNRGKGAAVRRGIVEAAHPLILISDADLATPIEEVEGFLPWIDKGFDIVIASRNLPESRIHTHQPWYRQLMGKTFPLLVRLFALREFRDTQCGFKLLRAEPARHIAPLQTIDRFCFDVEMLFIAKCLLCKIKEAPVTWNDQPGSKVRILRDSGNMLLDLLRIRWRHRGLTVENAAKRAVVAGTSS